MEMIAWIRLLLLRDPESACSVGFGTVFERSYVMPSRVHPQMT